jgi:hypothetical protein
MTPLQTIIEQQQERLPEGYKRFSTAGEQTPSDLIAQTATEGYLAGLRAAMEGLPEKEEIKDCGKCNACELVMSCTTAQSKHAWNTCRQIIKDHLEQLIAEVEGNTK